MPPQERQMEPQSVVGRMSPAAEISQGKGLRLVGFPAAPLAVVLWLCRKNKGKKSQRTANWMNFPMGRVASQLLPVHAASLPALLAG